MRSIDFPPITTDFEDLESFSARLRFVMEGLTQLQSSSVSAYVLNELKTKVEADVKIPGFNGVKYPKM